MAVLFFAGCAEDISGDGDGNEMPEGAQLVVDSKDQFSVERPAWIDDDTIIFSWNQDTQNEQLWLVTIGGSPSRFSPDGAKAYQHPVYSPELGLVAFTIVENQLAGSAIDALTLSSNPRFGKRLVAGGADSSAVYPNWGPGGRAIGYMQTGQFGDKQVSTTRFAMRELVSGSPLPMLTDNMRVIDFGGKSNYSRMAWYPVAGDDPFGGKVAYNRLPQAAEEGSEIYYWDLATDVEVRLTDDDTPDGHNNQNPSWSPDGAHIVYSSDFRLTSRPEFLRELFIVSVSSRAAMRLTLTGGDEKDPAWSRDGSKVAYVSGGDLYVLPIDSSVLPE